MYFQIEKPSDWSYEEIVVLDDDDGLGTESYLSSNGAAVVGRCNGETIIVHAGDEGPEGVYREAPTLRRTTKSVREGKRRQTQNGWSSTIVR